MSRKSSVIILALLLALSGVILWNKLNYRASAATVQPDVNSLALMPPGTSTIFGLDMDGLRASPLYAAWRQKFAAKLQEREYTEFVSRTGFDPERDLEGVTGGAWKNGDQPAMLAVVTVRYNRANLAALLREKGSTAETYRGFEVFHSPHARRGSGPGSGSDPGTLALVDDRTILAGTAAAVQQALDLKVQPGPNVLSNSALIERVRRIGAENQVWAVSSAPGSFLPANLPPVSQANALRVLQGLEGSTVAVNAASDFRLLVEGSCANSEDARTLADAARGLLAMGRLAAPINRPEALDVLNSFRIEQEERQVRVTAQIPSQLLQNLIESPAAMRHPAVTR